MSESYLDKFKQLFEGLSRAYGQLHGGKEHSTIRETPSDAVWESHLKGEIGLGIVPIKDDGSVLWGAIDIDIKDISHHELAMRVKKLGLPLYVCKSKGKGYHCYFFYLRPGKQASLLRNRLRMWAAALQYSSAECFPKQDFLQGDQVGNWINLPYYGGYTESTRVCMTPEGKELTLNEFLDYVEPWNPDIPLPLPTVQGNFEDAPPCLETLLTKGIPAGQRNQGMYNIGIFLRKAYPEAWREQMRLVNNQVLEKSLSDKELTTIIKSLAKREYFYKCEEDPIASVCDKKLCLTRKFGVGHDNEKDIAAGFSHPDYQTLEKLDTRPPRYYLTVNGCCLDLATEELMIWGKLQKCLFEALDELPASNRKVEEEWRRTLAGLIKNVVIHEAPPEASDSGQVMAQLDEWVEHATTNDAALHRTDPFWTDGQTYISLVAFEQLLAAKRMDYFETNELVSLLRFQGWIDCTLEKHRKKYKLWRKTASQPTNLIMENFKIVDEINET